MLHAEATVRMCINYGSVLQVVRQALDNANLTENDLSAVAVTIGPGLSLCLRGMYDK